MGTRIRLKAISPTATTTGIWGPDGEYPIGHVFTLPDGVTLETSGYAGRAELVDAEKTEAHEPVTNPAAPAEPVDPVVTDPTVKTYTASATDSPGWWVITDETGAEVGKKVRPADGQAFNELDADGKAKFIADQEA
jgi:hypothetical protein